MKKIKAFGICVYKINKNKISILMCKSVKSTNKWGFLKGVSLKNETQEQTAIREFEEECGILVNKIYLEKFFYQENDEKDIGIYLVNIRNIVNVNSYFDEDKLYEKFLSDENSIVKFFDIRNLPEIKNKQNKLIVNILDILKNNNLEYSNEC